jgi:hypothetical protein
METQQGDQQPLRDQGVDGLPDLPLLNSAAVVSLPRTRISETDEFDRTPTSVTIESLVWATSPRSQGEDDQHIQRLVEAEWPLPPILVHRPTMRILDGYHRVSAAKRKGWQSIAAYFVDGSEESAFVVAVQENVIHGLPLSLPDRRAAASRILQTHAHWSDRVIAAKTGLSAKTVCAIRRATEERQQLHGRLGKDGRIRPLNATVGRQVAAELISSRPNASLREIAQAAGISPSTVRDVRARLSRGEDPVVAPERVTPRRGQSKPRRRASTIPDEPADIKPILLALSNDPALRMNAAGRELLRWLHIHAVNGADNQRIPASVPQHCHDHLVELARRCAANWAFIAAEWAGALEEDSAPHLHVAQICRLGDDRCG